MKHFDFAVVYLVCLLSLTVQTYHAKHLQRSNGQLEAAQDTNENELEDKIIHKRWVDVDDDENLVSPDAIKHSESNKDNTDFTKIVESFNNGLTEKLGALSDTAKLNTDQLSEQDDKYIKAAELASNANAGHILASRPSDLEKYEHEIDPDVHRQIQAALAQDGNSPEALNEVKTALSHGMPPQEVLESANHAIHTNPPQLPIAMPAQQYFNHPRPIHKFVGHVIHKVTPSEHRYIPMKHIFLKHMPQILQRLRIRPHRVIHRPRIIIVKEPHVQHHHEYCKFYECFHLPFGLPNASTLSLKCYVFACYVTGIET